VDVSDLVRLELDRHDWAGLRCGCGDSADHVPLQFEAILTAETPRQMVGYTLDDHLEVSGNLFECAVPAVGVILAALAGHPSTLARSVLLDSLSRLVTGDPHYSEAALGAGDLGEQCRDQARDGFWIIMQAGFTGSADDADMAADICEAVDTDERRAGFYHARLRERVAYKTKRRRSRP
jgi:hypothetical protein